MCWYCDGDVLVMVAPEALCSQGLQCMFAVIPSVILLWFHGFDSELFLVSLFLHILMLSG